MRNLARTRNKVLLVIGAATLVVGMAPTTAGADWEYWAASAACSWNASITSHLTIDNSGYIYNSNTATGPQPQINCGFAATNKSSSSTTDYAYIYFNDHNGGSLMEDNVICGGATCTPTGNSCYTHQTRFGDASGGTTAPNTFGGGAGYIALTNLQKPSFPRTNIWCQIARNTSPQNYVKTVLFSW